MLGIPIQNILHTNHESHPCLQNLVSETFFVVPNQLPLDMISKNKIPIAYT